MLVVVLSAVAMEIGPLCCPSGCLRGQKGQCDSRVFRGLCLLAVVGTVHEEDYGELLKETGFSRPGEQTRENGRGGAGYGLCVCALYPCIQNLPLQNHTRILAGSSSLCQRQDKPFKFIANARWGWTGVFVNSKCR